MHPSHDQFQNFRDKHSSQPGGGSDKGAGEKGSNEHNNSVDNSSETMSTNSANSPVRLFVCCGSLIHPGPWRLSYFQFSRTSHCIHCINRNHVIDLEEPNFNHFTCLQVPHVLSHQNSTGGGGNHHASSNHREHHGGGESDAKRRHKSASEEGKVRDRDDLAA